MKAKLVKYPYNEKKYRWDTWKLGEEFQYFWDESLPNNFETIEPYIKKDIPVSSTQYGRINLLSNSNSFGYSDKTITKGGTIGLVDNNWFVVKKDITNDIDGTCYLYYTYTKNVYYNAHA